MPDWTAEDWYRLLTVALLAVDERPFPNVNGVALDQRGLVVLLEDDKEDIAGRVQEQFGINPAIRTIGPIAPIAQGGDPADTAKAGPNPGTLAALVKNASKNLCFLTCDHVVGQLAGQNVGDPVYSGKTQIGTFTKGSSVSTTVGIQNRVDAALIDLTNPSAHLAGVRAIGPVRGVKSTWAFGDRLDKYGIATRLTTGDSVYKVSHLVPYASGTALFVDQIGIDSIRPSPFAQSGDSGSLVVDKNGDAVGLLFAAAVNSNLGFANPISDVLHALGVSFV